MSIKGSALRKGQIVPHLVVNGVPEAIDFYKRAFGAVETYRSPLPQGGGFHAQLRIGDGLIMLTDESNDPDVRKSFGSPRTLGGTTFTVQLYVDNVDEAFRKATEAGATGLLPPADAFFGDRFSMVLDPFGHSWGLVTIKEELTAGEISQRMELVMQAHEQL